MAYDYGGSFMKKLYLYLVGGGEAKSILQMYQVYQTDSPNGNNNRGYILRRPTGRLRSSLSRPLGSPSGSPAGCLSSLNDLINILRNENCKFIVGGLGCYSSYGCLNYKKVYLKRPHHFCDNEPLTQIFIVRSLANIRPCQEEPNLRMGHGRVFHLGKSERDGEEDMGPYSQHLILCNLIP
jgi:hypothetical protein